jgi:hypothetical protein
MTAAHHLVDGPEFHPYRLSVDSTRILTAGAQVKREESHGGDF